MNPFAQAKLLGKSSDEILKFLQNASPNLSEKIKQALALGYSADEIMRFLGNVFDTSSAEVNKTKRVPSYEKALNTMGDQKPESIKQRRAQRESDVLSEVMDPNRMLSAALGAGVGGLAGGPVGVISGAVGGAAGYGDLLKKYQKHVAEGGQLSLQDWLKSIMKGVGIGAVGTQIPKIAEAIQTISRGEQPEEIAGEAVVPEEVAVPPPVQEVPRQDKKASYDIFKERGQENIIDSLSVQVSDGQVVTALTQLYGPRFLKDLETQYGKPGEEIIAEAAQYSREKGKPEMVAKEAEITPLTPKIDEKPQKRAIKELDPDFNKYIASIDRIDTKGKGKTITAQEIAAMPSSNVRYVDYDEDKNKMQVLFAPSGKAKHGSIYEYDNVSKDTVEKILEGEGVATTTGAGSLRAWFSGKDPSIGRAFIDKIKSLKDNKGDPIYPYKKISEKEVDRDQLLKVRGADAISKTTRYIDAFDDLFLASEAKMKREGMKSVNDSLKDLPDNILDGMILDTLKRMRSEKKEATKAGKTKRYKGGREEYVKTQVLAKAAELKKKRRQ